MRTKNVATLLLSDVFESVQLEIFVESLVKSFDKVCILYLGNESDPIYEFISRLSLSNDRISILKIEHRFNLLWWIIEVRKVANRARIFCFVSGSQLSLQFLAISRIFHANRIILYRHYANLHKILGSRRGAIRDYLEEKLATNVICASKVTRQALIDRGVKETKISVVRYCVDLQRYNSIWNKEVHTNRVNDPSFRIGVVARISKTKGIIQLIKAIALVREIENCDVRLEIIGQASDDIELLKDLKANVWPFVSWHGFLKNPSVLYKNWDLLAHLPVSLQAEGFGVVYIEGLASGIPCLFSKSGILAEMEISEPGVIIVEDFSVDNLFIKLVNLIEAKDTFTNRNFDSKVFSKENMTKQLELFLGSLLGQQD